MSQKLLLADDSVTIRRVIELTFADEDVRVESVSSGREALARIEAEPPDIVLADAGMPDVSGYDIAAFVKGRPNLRHIPVILLAGAFEPLDEARSRKSGSDGVLVKPFEPQMVVARVRELLPVAGERPYSPPPRPPAADDVRDVAAVPAPPAPDIDLLLDRDSRELRTSRVDSGGFERQDFGEWDLPVRPPADSDAAPAQAPEAAADVFAAPAAEPVVPPLPPPVALTPQPAPVPPPSAPPAPPRPVPAAPASAAPLAEAFSSLLAAEEGRPHAPVRVAFAGAPASPQLTEADVDLIVDKVIARLGLGVRGAVIDVAERLVKAEIDRLKALR